LKYTKLVSGGIFLLVALLLSLSVNVYAVRDTLINVSVIERAHQNVTFAENFDLVESVTGSYVQGWINVTNPSTHNVYDIRITLNNLSNLETNVTYFDGRNGSQTILQRLTNLSLSYGVINRTPQPMVYPHNLDKDNMTDFIWINQSHLILDFSSEQRLLTFALTEPANLNPHDVTFNMVPITLTNGKTVGWLNGSFAFNVPWQVDAGVINIIENANPNYVVIHIPELRPGDYTVFTYNASPSIDPPVDMQTDYYHPQKTKVLAGECFNVSQNATNNFAQQLNLSSVNITMLMQPVVWNSSSLNFTFDVLFEQGDWTNVSNQTNLIWYWAVNGGNMTWGEVYNINFSVCAPDSVPNSSSYVYLREELHYTTPGTITGLELSDLRARADVRFNFTKRIDEPTNTLENRYVMWETEPSIGTDLNITFNVTKISMWVTRSMDPNDATILKERYFPVKLINETQMWNSELDIGEMWYFNYTDGSRADAPPPIIWMMPYYHIADVNNQLIRLFETREGEDYYFKYIYVVNGYWLEIEKNVSNIAEDQYNISLFVWNRGPGFTPRDLTVTIYDFVPEEFIAYNFGPMWNATSVVSGAFNGTAYSWDVAPDRTPQNASFAPFGQANSTWNATYIVNGTGDYRVSELYIVGLDPRLVDGGSSNEVISVMSSLASRSTEAVYVMIVVALVAINVLNYVLTKRKE
jgi:hypothetical protein